MTDPSAVRGLLEPWGHEDLKRRIGQAVADGRLPQSLLLHGPPGVGKRTLALWLGALLQCESDGPPCGACRSCRLAARHEHPDVHYHFPMPRPKKAGSRAKLREAIEAQRLERLEALREDPHAVLDEGETTGIYLAAIENVRLRASRRPAMSARAVFIMAEADRMVPQSASPEAANAFLKLLEEPPPFAFLILTSGRPAALLPTIRSRAASLRVPPLGEETVAGYLEEEVGAEATAARRAARLSEGSIGRARTLLEGDDDDAVEVADRLLAAALGGAAARYRAANEFSARGARAILAPALEGLQRRLRDVLCGASGVPDEALDPSIAQRAAGRRGITGPAVLAALEYVERALEGVQQNLNPQASVAVLLSDMSRAFAEPGGAPGA